MSFSSLIPNILLPNTTHSGHPSILPHFHLLCIQKSAATAFTKALSNRPNLNSKINHTIHQFALSTLTSSLKFDLVVSPANSYGILDGGFDDAISRAFAPKDDYHALTRHVQAELYREYKGYLPPGTCHIIRIPEEWKGDDTVESRLRYGDGKGWGCKWLAVVPTMMVPMLLSTDNEIVYRCVWAILAAVERHNRDMSKIDQVKSILMTPLGTGTGGLSDERWADRCVLAMNHFVEACEKPEVWGQMNWTTASRIEDELSASKVLNP